MGAVAVAGLLAGCGSGASSAAAPPTPAPAGSAEAGGTAPAASQGSLAGKVIVLDPGHNGANARHPEIINKLVDVINGRKPCNTTGTATNDNYAEHAYTWDVSRRLGKVLGAGREGHPDPAERHRCRTVRRRTGEDRQSGACRREPVHSW